jgi:NADPH:quinone reductase-like Zn-dependent oxidoreductase
MNEPGGPEVLVLETIADPEPGPGEVVVSLKAAALNRRDVFVRKGVAKVPLPLTLGSDGAGIVHKVGAGVSGVAVGDEVIILPSLAWGPDQRAPGAGFRILGGPDQGTYAEQIVIPAENVYPKPGRLSWHEAAALPLAGLTAWRSLMTRARVVPGETVLIIGIGGGVATFALNLAKAAGCRVVVTSSSDDKLAAAKELGADVGVNYKDAGDEWPAAVKEANGGGVDVVIDSVGSTWGGSIDACAPGGRVVVFGGTRAAMVDPQVRPVTLGQVALLGTTMGSPAEFRQLLAAVDNQTWTPVIDSVRPLGDAAAAHEREENGLHFGKLVLDCQ